MPTSSSTPRGRRRAALVGGVAILAAIVIGWQRLDLDAPDSSADGTGEVLEVRGAGTVLQRVELGRPRSSFIRAPVVAQSLPNTCESAALEILTATLGNRVSQKRLQAALPRSGPLDPVGAGADRVWGDPEVGYVGRPEGGGPAGGFGVYQEPVIITASGFGIALEDLSRRPVSQIVRRVLGGGAVMVWVGLSDGPYGDWRSPDGRRVRVNYGEHTVVLNGVTEDGRLRVVNPLKGARELWRRCPARRRN